MPTISGGRVLANALAAHGVRHVGSLHGGHLDPFWDACLDTGIRLIDMRHEQAAVHLAEGWAWATGETGVAAVTAGPGVTDAMTGIVNAQVSGAPVFVIGGHVHSFAEGTRALQDMDVIPMVSPFTKMATTARDATGLAGIIATAMATARGGRPGATFVDIPAEQLARKVDTPDASPIPIARPAADGRLVDQAAAALARAERPVILAGSGVHWSRASDILQRFVEATGIPVLTHAGGRGSVADDHPLCVGSGSPVAGGAAIAALTAADVILCVGVRFNFTLGNGRAPLFNAEAQVIRVDIDPEEPQLGRPASVALVGDAGAVLEQLDAALSGTTVPTREAWVESLQDARTRSEAAQRQQVDSAKGIHPLALIHATNDVLAGTGTTVIDGGEIQVWGLMGTKVSRPGRFLTVGPLGTLGVGVPFALAAKLARPDEPTVLVSGDGAFGFNGMELESAVRHRVPIVVVISNDRGWGMSRHMQGLAYGYDRVAGTELAETTRYDILAQGLGATGYLVNDLGELRPTIDKAISMGEPACIDVRVDRDIVSTTTRRMVGAGAGH